MFLVILSTFEMLAMLKSVWWTRRKRARCAVIRNGARLLLLSTRWTFIITWLDFFFALARSAEKWLTKCVWITTFSFFIFIWFTKKIKERLKFSRLALFADKKWWVEPQVFTSRAPGSFFLAKNQPKETLFQTLCVVLTFVDYVAAGWWWHNLRFACHHCPPPLLHGSSQQSLLFFSSTPTFSRPRYIYFG